MFGRLLEEPCCFKINCDQTLTSFSLRFDIAPTLHTTQSKIKAVLIRRLIESQVALVQPDNRLPTTISSRVPNCEMRKKMKKKFADDANCKCAPYDRLEESGDDRIASVRYPTAAVHQPMWRWRWCRSPVISESRRGRVKNRFQTSSFSVCHSTRRRRCLIDLHRSFDPSMRGVAADRCHGLSNVLTRRRICPRARARVRGDSGENRDTVAYYEMRWRWAQCWRIISIIRLSRDSTVNYRYS